MRVFLDACVLYPTVLREVLTGCGARGLLVPLWSGKVLAEWRATARREGHEDWAVAEIAALGDAFPEACVPEADTPGPLPALPDPGDAHVLRAALAGHAEVIVTANLRDFPARVLAPLGLSARDPDRFLRALWDEAPDPVAEVARAVHARARAAGGPAEIRALLQRAGLPRLGRALERAA